MNKTKSAVLSGCLIWLVLLGTVGSCIMPIFFAIGGISSVSDFAIQTTGAWICDDGMTPQTRTYATTTTDSNGNRQPSTAYVLQCVDSSGVVVKEDPVAYAFIWIGLWAALGMAVTAILCFVFAAPGGLLAAKFLEKIKVRKPASG
ncbi:MAG: hypothetical protein IT310_00350 [Anaerolineales bacterium]|nr:hypothetical protein [Anaerolineales bacterium]